LEAQWWARLLGSPDSTYRGVESLTLGVFEDAVCVVNKRHSCREITSNLEMMGGSAEPRRLKLRLG